MDMGLCVVVCAGSFIGGNQLLKCHNHLLSSILHETHRIRLIDHMSHHLTTHSHAAFYLRHEEMMRFVRTI